MEICKGDIVQSKNGRDEGNALFVIATDEDYLILADGKSRKLEHPKRKKGRHCQFLARLTDCRVSEKIRDGEKIGNSEIRRAIAAYCAVKT